MANMKTDDSGIITTEFYTGRCPIRCEMCFVNFGEGGSSVPFGIYSTQGMSNFKYATCQTTLERLRKDAKQGGLDWVAGSLCGVEQYERGDNNYPRNWGPVKGLDLETGEVTEFWSGMNKEDYRRILKPLGDDLGLYSIPKVPEAPWFRKIPATRVYNGQWLPSILRVNSMSDSSVTPSEFIRKVRDIWGNDCFFNTNIHAIKRFPANMRSGLYHKVVVTANPGLQQLHPGLNRYKLHFRQKELIAYDPDVLRVASEIYYTKASAELSEFLMQQSWDTLNGIATLAIGAETMKGHSRDRRWHFFNPQLVSSLGSEFAQFERNIKFYRVRALPTIQPNIEHFGKTPVVFTVLRFKTVAQALEFANKYDLEVQCKIQAGKDEVVCQYYGVDYDVVPKGERTEIKMRDNTSLNASPLRGEWTYLHYSHNFFRAEKEQMGYMQYVCDRASKSCKACGLCATLDGTEPDQMNPVLAQLGLYPKQYDDQLGYLCDTEGEPVPTAGVVGRTGKGKTIDMTPVSVGIGRTQAEMSFFHGDGQHKYWSFAEAERARKAKEREAKRRVAGEVEEEDGAEYEQNPVRGAIDQVSDPAMTMIGILDSHRDPKRNPSGTYDIEWDLAKTLKTVVSYGADGAGGPDDFWVQGWNTHEDVATMIAYVYWWLMVLAHNDGLTDEEAFADASDFSWQTCGMDLFEEDFIDLSALYYNTSYWNDQFGPTH